MKKTALFLLVLLLSLLCLSANASSIYQMGDTVEDFSVTTPEGTTYTLSTLLAEHKAVLLNFWFVNCPWCVYEFPYLEEAYSAMSDDIAVLALTPYDSNEAIAQFQQENALTFPMARDDISLAARFGVTGYPTSILIDRYGVYCFSQSGAIPSTSTFMRLFAPFADDAYETSLVGFEIPAAAPPSDVPDGVALSAALNAEGGTLAFKQNAIPSLWPWLIGEKDGRSYAYSSNSFEDSTSALISVSISAQAGDVLAFDYLTSCAAGDDVLALYVNENPVKIFSGENVWQSYAHAFKENGDYEIIFAYMKTTSASSGDDLAALDNVRLLSGDAAQSALSLNPVYPRTLSGTEVVFEMLNEGTRKVVIHDESGTLDSLYPTAVFYLVPADKLQARIRIGDEVDPDAALLQAQYDGWVGPLASLPSDMEGYLVNVEMDSLSLTGFAWNALVVYPIFNNYDHYEPVFYFASEADLDHFCAYNVTENGKVSWAYADESIAYTLVFVDQHGAPIHGVIANVCSDTFCMPMTTDENGVITFENLPYPYEIHILKAPEGVSFDPSAACIAPVTGGEVSFTLNKQ